MNHLYFNTLVDAGVRLQLLLKIGWHIFWWGYMTLKRARHFQLGSVSVLLLPLPSTVANFYSYLSSVFAFFLWSVVKSVFTTALQPWAWHLLVAANFSLSALVGTLCSFVELCKSHVDPIVLFGRQPAWDRFTVRVQIIMCWFSC